MTTETVGKSSDGMVWSQLVQLEDRTTLLYPRTNLKLIWTKLTFIINQWRITDIETTKKSTLAATVLTSKTFAGAKETRLNYEIKQVGVYITLSLSVSFLLELTNLIKLVGRCKLAPLYQPGPSLPSSSNPKTSHWSSSFLPQPFVSP